MQVKAHTNLGPVPDFSVAYCPLDLLLHQIILEERPAKLRRAYPGHNDGGVLIISWLSSKPSKIAKGMVLSHGKENSNVPFHGRLIDFG